MDKRRPFQADIHECCFHARQHPHHLTFIDIANDAFAAGPLDIGFLQHAVFNQCHPGFHRGYVDQNFFAHAWFSLLRGQFCQTGQPA